MQFAFDWDEEELDNGLTKVTIRRPVIAVSTLGVHFAVLKAVSFHVPDCPIFGVNRPRDIRWV